MSHPAFKDKVTRVRVAEDDWGEKDFDVEKKIKCRIESTSKTMIDDNGRTLQMQFKVFMGGRADVLLSDKLKIGDEEYVIRSLVEAGGIGYTRIKVATV